jgi:hypothetical protein
MSIKKKCEPLLKNLYSSPFMDRANQPMEIWNGGGTTMTALRFEKKNSLKY